MTRETIILITFTIYVAFMVWIGFAFYGKNKDMADYILGGRRLNAWVAALSAQASDMSGWLLTGLPGLAYLSIAGAKEAVWTAVGLAVGTLFNWLFVARRLRSYTEVSGNSLTMPDYFESRFRDESKTLRLVSAIAIVVFFLIYTSSMFVAGAKLFSSVFGLDYLSALIIGTIIIVSYTYMGGFMAVSWTDFFQGMLMFFAVLIVPVVAMNVMGGPAVAFAAIDPSTWQIFPNSGDVTVLLVASSMAWGLGYFGQPHILARFMAIRRPSDVPPAATVAMIWVILSLAGAVFLGIVGKYYFAANPLPEGAHETVFMALVNTLFSPVMAGVLLSAILAAIMSTADSQLLVTSSAISSDLYKAIFKKDATDRELIVVSRAAVVGVSLIALLMALDPDSSIFSIVSYAWAGLGASFGPTIVMSLYWKRMTREGAIGGVIAGGVGTILFKNLRSLGGMFEVYELLPAFILSVVVIIVVSLMTKEPGEEILKEFEQVKLKSAE